MTVLDVRVLAKHKVGTWQQRARGAGAGPGGWAWKSSCRCGWSSWNTPKQEEQDDHVTGHLSSNEVMEDVLDDRGTESIHRWDFPWLLKREGDSIRNSLHPKQLLRREF